MGTTLGRHRGRHIRAVARHPLTQRGRTVRPWSARIGGKSGGSHKVQERLIGVDVGSLKNVSATIMARVKSNLARS